MRESDLPKELSELRDKIKAYARGFGLDFFEVIYEVLDYEEINGIAASGGFPKRYPHWRFGMDYDQLSKGYTWGLQKIYEMVINTDPCYAYLLRSNAYIDQKIVMAHVYAHCDFFKNNYWFSKTNRKMMDQMANHSVRVRRAMDKYGEDAVETFIDRCLSIEDLIDPYLPFAPQKQSRDENIDANITPAKLKVQRSYMNSFINPKDYLEEQMKKMKEQNEKSKKFPAEPQRDILKFLIEHGRLETWQTDILSMIREEAYYFSPQRMTKIMNEGWATYWHSKILTEKALNTAEIIDFADRHAGVTAVQKGQLNPYKLGVELFRNIEMRWNKGKFGKDYEQCDSMEEKKNWNKNLGLGMEKIFSVRKTHNDITFIDDFFNEEFCEDQKMYTYALNPRTNKYEIKTRDWKTVKEEILSAITNGGTPLIMIEEANFRNRGELLLKHEHNGNDLDIMYAKATMENISKLWGRPVHIETINEGQKKRYTYNEGEFSEEKI